MGKSRDVRTFRVAALLRLFQLLRVPQQNEVLPRGSTGQHVGQGHLASLIDEQNMHGVPELLSGPEERSTAKNIHSPTLQALQRFIIRTNFTQRTAVWIR